MTLAIETRGLTKIFRKSWGWEDLLRKRDRDKKETAALANVDLSVQRGEVFALLGPNGAGKTTLLKILSTLLLPNSGRAHVYGYDTITQSEKVRANISLVLGEERSFYWRLTGRQNLEFFATLYNLPKKEAKQRINRAFDLLEIEDPDKRYQEYSAGTKHRLALARSFLNNAKLIFMDELTRSLDPNAASNLRYWIREELKKNPEKTVFFTTHQTEEAEALADRIAILKDGAIKACGSMEELRRQIGDPSASLETIFRRVTLHRGSHDL